MQHRAAVRVLGLRPRPGGVRVGLLLRRCCPSSMRSPACRRSPRSGGSSCWRTACAPAARCCTTAWGTRTGRRSTCCRYAYNHGREMRASGVITPAAGVKQGVKGLKRHGLKSQRPGGTCAGTGAERELACCGHNVRGVRWPCTAPRGLRPTQPTANHYHLVPTFTHPRTSPSIRPLVERTLLANNPSLTAQVSTHPAAARRADRGDGWHPRRQTPNGLRLVPGGCASARTGAQV